MNKLTKAALFGLTAVLLTLLLPLDVAAGGLAAAPSTIDIDDALRGEEYQRALTVFNLGEDALTFQLSASGDVMDWVSFRSSDDPDTAVETIAIPGQEDAALLVRFNIPDDAPVGTAAGAVYVATTPAEAETGQAVVFQVKVKVTITVTGTPILTGVVSSISTSDVEAGHPLQIRVGFQNSGNVVATPQVGVAITKDGAAIDSFTFAETEVKPARSEAISVEWDTSGRESGDYTAHVAVSLDEEIISSRELNFAILPVGTSAGAGVFEELALQGEPKLGATAKIQATFSNTGEIDTRAKFIGEVYCDNELIDALESEETLIPVGQKDILTSYVKLERSGNYDIKGYINYEGKKTKVKEISFALGEPGGGLPFNLSTRFIALIAVIVVLVGVIAFMALRRRKAA